MCNNTNSEKVSLSAVFCCILIIGIYFSKTKYFNVGSYFVPFLCLDVILLFENLIYKKIFNYSFITKNLLLFLGYILVSILLLKKQYEQDMVFTYFMFYTTLILALQREWNKKSIKIIVNSLMFSGVILSILTIIQHKMPYSYEFRFAVYYSASEFFDVNFMGAFLLLPAFFSFEKLLNKFSIYKLFVFGIIAIGICMSGSRGAVVPLLVGICLRLLYEKKSKFSTLCVISIVIVGIVVFLPESMYDRFFTTSYISTNTKRFYDWTYGWNAFKDSPILGSGFAASSTIIINKFFVGVTAHNMYIVTLIQSGIIGALPLFVTYIYPIITLIKDRCNSKILIYYCAFMFSLGMIEPNASLVYFVPFMVFYILCDYYYKNRERDHNILL